jgi:hypothetical protein
VIDPSGTVVDGAVDVVVGTKLGYGSVGTYNGNDVQLDDSGWIRCPTAAMDTGCTAIGTGEDTYTTVAADVGKYVSFRELVSNASGSLEAKAIPRRVKAAAVADPTPTPTAAPAPTATPAPTPAPPTIAEIIKRAMDKAKSALGTPTVVPISGVNLGDFGSVFGGTNKPAVNLLTGQFGYVYCQPKLVKNAKCEFVLEPVVEPITAEVPLARAAAKKKARKIKLKKVTISLEPDQGAVAKLKITKAQRKAIGKLKKRSIRLKLTVKRDGESKASAVRLPIKKK